MRIIRVDEPEGNAHAVMGIVSDMLRQIHGRGAEGRQIIEEYCQKAMSGDYENLKKVSMEYVPGLIDFAKSDEVDITYNIIEKPDEEYDEYDEDEGVDWEDDYLDNEVKGIGAAPTK